MDRTQCIVVGAGAVGLAVAKSLSAAGKEVVVLEQSADVGQGISSRNSEVIHAGIYYPGGSLKARLCVEGRELLYQYAASHNVPHRAVGKLIIATTDAEATELETILKRAEVNGVPLEPIETARALKAIEPAIEGVAGLLSPSTGIVSAHDFMNSLVGDIEQFGGQVALHSKVARANKTSSGFMLECEIEGDSYQLACDYLVNCAGLGAQTFAEKCDFLSSKPPVLHLCKGAYFTYQGSSPFQRLIYPVPEKNTVGLGIHATLDMGGQCKFGPDTTYIESEDYSVADATPTAYVEAIRRYFPTLEVEKLTPGYAGVRPKLSGPGEAARDFAIEGPNEHGIPRFAQLFGIESPGLTASLAIGEYVRGQLVTI